MKIKPIMRLHFANFIQESGDIQDLIEEIEGASVECVSVETLVTTFNTKFSLKYVVRRKWHDGPMIIPHKLIVEKGRYLVWTGEYLTQMKPTEFEDTYEVLK